VVRPRRACCRARARRWSSTDAVRTYGRRRYASRTAVSASDRSNRSRSQIRPWSSGLVEHARPVAACRCDGDWDLDAPLDDLHGGSARGCGAGLFPRAVPARGRAPLWDWPAAAGGDGPVAPGVVSGRGPTSRRVVLVLRCVGSLRLALRPLHLLAPAALGLGSSSSVVSGPLGAHAAESADELRFSRHHVLRDPMMQGVCGPVILLFSGSDKGASGARSGSPSGRDRVLGAKWRGVSEGGFRDMPSALGWVRCAARPQGEPAPSCARAP
jgi:hypothetical protein